MPWLEPFILWWVVVLKEGRLHIIYPLPGSLLEFPIQDGAMQIMLLQIAVTALGQSRLTWGSEEHGPLALSKTVH